ncbi:hypothetical protein [Mycobacterium sp.]|uniref:hypothetical protein n=1 Tax=Mycobacterium sp. TaxID=1785 RepID=UPI0025CEF161|nr:hypothetical protein [Mycobacterium sp.]MBW0014075.1 hypothetical protein [Mycobacterium sp.]
MPVSGCSSHIDGRPVAAPGAGPTEPTFPTPRPTTPTAAPSAPSSTPAPSSSPANPTAPAGAIPLAPDQNGYVFIETKSGMTRCQINKESVGCEAPFTNSPLQDGEHANGVSINSSGSVQWVLGNLGAIPTVTIDYKTYQAQGWTISATADGTRFTNDRTGHGMFVSIEKVNTF